MANWLLLRCFGPYMITMNVIALLNSTHTHTHTHTHTPCTAGFLAISVTVRLRALKNEPPLTGVEVGVAWDAGCSGAVVEGGAGTGSVAGGGSAVAIDCGE